MAMPLFSKSASTIVPHSETESFSPALSTGSSQTFIVFLTQGSFIQARRVANAGTAAMGTKLIYDSVDSKQAR